MYVGTVCLGILVPVIVFVTSYFDWYLLTIAIEYTLLISSNHKITSVAFHGGSSHFFSIGIYPVSDTAGIGIFRLVLLSVSFGGNTFLRFCGNSFFEKFRGNSFFSSKGGRSVQEGGRGPPFLGKRGLPPIF